ASILDARIDGTAADVWLTGRQANNQSRIVRTQLIARDGSMHLALPVQATLALGEPGTFDADGTSYPCAVSHDGLTYLYYTAWVATRTPPFINQVGPATFDAQGAYIYRSRAPILPLTDDEPFGTGSV